MELPEPWFALIIRRVSHTWRPPICCWSASLFKRSWLSWKQALFLPGGTGGHHGCSYISCSLITVTHCSLLLELALWLICYAGVVKVWWEFKKRSFKLSFLPLHKAFLLLILSWGDRNMGFITKLEEWNFHCPPGSNFCFLWSTLFMWLNKEPGNLISLSEKLGLKYFITCKKMKTAEFRLLKLSIYRSDSEKL